MGVERRRHPRVPEDMQFALQGGPLPPGVVARAQLVDISEGGAAFECDHAIPAGQVIHFELRLPIHVEAKILHQSDVDGRHRHGMTFEKVEWLDRETLRRYIARKLGKTL